MTARPVHADPNMRNTNYASKARIGGHPIHPMLVHFPIALWICGVLALLANVGLGQVFWYEVATLAFIAGSGFAVLAAVPGTIDLFFGIPRNTHARQVGLAHMALNVVALVLFASAGFVMYGSYDRAITDDISALSVNLPLVLSIVGTVILSVSGTLGSRLVHKEHVGQHLDDNAGVHSRPDVGRTAY